MNSKLQIFKTKTVLYAEDERGVQNNIGEILGLYFEKVLLASDGEEAIRLFDNNHTDLLMLDICMPKVDGLEVLRRIREENKKIPVIILTAHNEQEYLQRAVELNITRYLSKPFSKNSLQDALISCVDWMACMFGGLVVNIHQGLSYDVLSKALIIQGEKIYLSKKEYQLLEFFLINRSRMLEFDSIINEVWEEDVGKEALKSIIKSLRKKAPSLEIQNVFGNGYILQ
ncbi:response regulator transcription factor [Helicobacter sp. 11S03491-1]|uniref:response regulator transcription factor n=1 Tax=Helicobacter sp. 11S03491-1 TaxID=1476196 RepID=UPI000BA687AC|nr:response regulator transcription factor [Helicobacter sp. 11S03491-1]PAF42670.1 hypothetical protein BKH45_03940 [Helicobacter sp. 11S03491-1]